MAAIAILDDYQNVALQHGRLVAAAAGPPRRRVQPAPARRRGRGARARRVRRDRHHARAHAVLRARCSSGCPSSSCSSPRASATPRSISTPPRSATSRCAAPAAAGRATAELAIAPDAGARPPPARGVPRHAPRRRLADHGRLRSRRPHARHPRASATSAAKVGKIGAAFGMKLIAWSENLTARARQGARRRARQQGRAVPPRRRDLHPSRAVATHARPGRRARASP